MKSSTLFALAATGVLSVSVVSHPAHGDQAAVAQRNALMLAIDAVGGCRTAEVIGRMKDGSMPAVPPDEEIVYSLINNGCAEPLQDTEVAKRLKGSPLIISAAERVWNEWQSYYTDSRKVPNFQADKNDFLRRTKALGIAFGLADDFCKQSPGSKFCDLKAKMANAEAETNELAALTSKNQKTAMGPYASLITSCNNRQNGNSWMDACKELTKKRMHTISRPMKWDGYEHHRLIQLIDGYAVFANTELGHTYDEKGDAANIPLVAIKQADLRKNLQPGEELNNLPALSGSEFDCLKFLSEGMTKNQLGFPVKVYRYKAVVCPANQPWL